jgi:hypothetical protein
MPPTAVFRGNREDLRRVLRALPAILAGRVPDPLGIARMVQLRLGTVLLSKIQQAFLVKSRRGTGDDGIKWAELAPATIAARTRTPAEERAFKAAKKRDPRLTALAFYGSREVDIGADTRRMLRSLTPGVEGAEPANPDQILRPGPGELVVGSNAPEAGPFHAGRDPHQPARPLWPADGSLPRPWADAVGEALVRALPLVLDLVTRNGGRV